MNVTPGPMASDGTVIVPSQALPDFVNGTVISGIDGDAFSNELSFIASQTDTPSVVWPGSLWFKRGEGQLYWGQTIDASVYTAVFCKLAPSFEILMQIDSSSYSAVPGQTVCLGQDPERATQYRSTDGSNKLTWRCNTHVVGTGISGAVMLYKRFTLQDTGVTEGPVRVQVWGEVECLFGSGASVVRGDHVAHVSKFWEARGVFQGWWYPFHYETAHSGTIISGYMMSNSAYTAGQASYKMYLLNAPLRGIH